MRTGKKFSSHAGGVAGSSAISGRGRRFHRRKIGVEIRKSCVAVAKPQAKDLVRQKAGDERNAAYEKDRSHH